jgi:hypothetical protein
LFLEDWGDGNMSLAPPQGAPDAGEAEILRAEGRKVPGVTVLLSRAPSCDFCPAEALVEGRTRDGRAGVHMCRHHYEELGVGLGAGSGEVLVPTGAMPLPAPPVPARQVGYARVIAEYALPVMPPHRLTYLASSGQKRERVEDGRTVVVLPPGGYVGGDALVDHIEFALKREGVNIEVLAALFRRVDAAAFESDLALTVRDRPTGRYTRVLWFLYEHLTRRRLDLPDAKTGNYVPVLDADQYFATRGEKSRRHRVLNNLLGTPGFCPVVRKTGKLERFMSMNLSEESARLVRQYDEDALKRAVSYLYTKETRSSFDIEGEHPSTSRTERFVALLRGLPKVPRLDKQRLVDLQEQTVDPRFASADYRVDQVYVGEQIDIARQKIHYIAPRPEDVPAMMDGLLALLAKVRGSGVDPVVSAAVASFGFVFIHPFADGNGRLHRALIHYVLSVTGFSPEGVIFPVSAVMLARRRGYDDCLESFSTPLMELVDYDESDDGGVTVRNETADHYRYFDATAMAEALYGWVEETVRNELRRELQFVVAFRETRRELERIVEMPDRQANLFIRLVMQNGGRLSDAKRKSLFSALTDEEVARMEQAIQHNLAAALARDDEVAG